MTRFFQPTEFDVFKKALAAYCRENRYSIMLTDDEIDQLSWYMSSTIVTPEATEKDVIDKLHFEIKRGLARRNNFELLLRGDDNAYSEFVSGQTIKLSHADFNRLSAEANALSDDMKMTVRVTCFLTLTETAKTKVRLRAGEIASNDAEQFLSQLSSVLIQNRNEFPILKSLSVEQLSLLQKAFWPNMHFRHMMFTEGGINMTRSFSEGVVSGNFDANAFQVWKWRWLTNLFGFQLGQGAKYFDAQVSQLCDAVIHVLSEIAAGRETRFLEPYLSMRAALLGFDRLPLPETEQLFLAHLAAYFHQVNGVTPELGRPILEGYALFCRENTGNILAKSYVRHFGNPEAITSTYVPAILNNAYLIFCKEPYSMNMMDAMRNATQFMCGVLNALYAFPSDQCFSFMDVASEKNLKLSLVLWMSDPHRFNFSELVAKAAPKLECAQSLKP